MTIYNQTTIIKTNREIDLMSREFASGPVDQGSVPGWVIPKIQKWYLMPPCLTLSIVS